MISNHFNMRCSFGSLRLDGQPVGSDRAIVRGTSGHGHGRGRVRARATEAGERILKLLRRTCDRAKAVAATVQRSTKIKLQPSSRFSPTAAGSA
jgi:hypothetical protein